MRGFDVGKDAFNFLKHETVAGSIGLLRDMAILCAIRVEDEISERMGVCL